MRQCIFCGTRAGSREHLLPAWVLERVKPVTFAGFIGHNKNVSFEAEWIVRTVCHGCNGGWMSNLETAVMPLIGRPIDDKSIALDPVQRTSVAAWSVKTAMVMDSTTKAARPLFYTQEERHALMTSTAIPSRTTVWLGRFLGTANLGAVSVDVNIRIREKVGGEFWPTRVTTFLVGHLVIQVVTVHIHSATSYVRAEYRNRTVRIRCREGPWNEILVSCWPPDGRHLYWPPVLAFHENINQLNFLSLADRYMLGREIPL